MYINWGNIRRFDHKGLHQLLVTPLSVLRELFRMPQNKFAGVAQASTTSGGISNVKVQPNLHNYTVVIVFQFCTLDLLGLNVYGFC